jgi:tRNA threonylcarbamoyladenosine biosynthesis protein TsaB
MKILAIDTASARCSAALWIDGATLQRGVTTPRDHARLLLPFVEELLRESALRLADLDVLAFGRGPGSFTGLRVACSVAQGLALGADLPVMPISDLRALALQAARMLPGRRPHRQVVACMDARMGEVYWAAFPMPEGLPADEGVLETVGVPESVTVDPARGVAAGIGAGFSAWPGLAGRLGVLPEDCLPGVEPDAQDVALLAAADLAAGRRAGPPEGAQPVYLRDNVASAPEKRPL